MAVDGISAPTGYGAESNIGWRLAFHPSCRTITRLSSHRIDTGAASADPGWAPLALTATTPLSEPSRSLVVDRLSENRKAALSGESVKRRLHGIRKLLVAVADDGFVLSRLRTVP